MSTAAITLPFADAIPPELASDTQAVLEKLATGKPLDPDTARRLREQADRIRDDIFRKYGLVDIGVPAIRELRDGA
jgi:hypothetical protein